MDLREAIPDEARRHPWEVARARFFHDVLHRGGRLRGPVNALDIGAGDGWFARQLAPRLAPSSTITCCDANYTDTWLTTHPDEDRLRFRRSPAGSRGGVVLLLDVLEHVEDDGGLLRSSVEANLLPGGVVLLSVPAWSQLFSAHDRWLGHHRRYSPSAARALVASSGLRIEREGGLFHGLLLPRALQSLAEHIFPGSEAAAAERALWSHGEIVTTAVEAALSIDNAFSRMASSVGWTLPGLSWWALCTA